MLCVRAARLAAVSTMRRLFARSTVMAPCSKELRESTPPNSGQSEGRYSYRSTTVTSSCPRVSGPSPRPTFVQRGWSTRWPDMRKPVRRPKGLQPMASATGGVMMETPPAVSNRNSRSIPSTETVTVLRCRRYGFSVRASGWAGPGIVAAPPRRPVAGVGVGLGLQARKAGRTASEMNRYRVIRSMTDLPIFR